MAILLTILVKIRVVVDLVIGVSYNADLAKTKAVLEAVVKANAGVLKSPAPQIAVAELGDSSVNLVVRPWVRGAEYWTFALN